MKRERKVKSEDAAPEEKPAKRARAKATGPSHLPKESAKARPPKKTEKLPSFAKAPVDELRPDKDSWLVFTDTDGRL